MKKIEVVKVFAQDKLQQLSHYAAGEIAVAPNNLRVVEESSTVLWELYNDEKFLGYAGITRPNFLVPGVFWLIGTSYRTKSDIAVFKEFAKDLQTFHSDVVTYVEKDWKMGERFAAFCGFVPESKEYTEYGRIYRKFVWRS